MATVVWTFVLYSRKGSQNKYMQKATGKEKKGTTVVHNLSCLGGHELLIISIEVNFVLNEKQVANLL